MKYLSKCIQLLLQLNCYSVHGHQRVHCLCCVHEPFYLMSDINNI